MNLSLSKKINKNKSFLLTSIGIIAFLSIFPLFIKNEFLIHVLIISVIWSIMGIGWNFIGGYAGQVSNGHALFYAIGAYTSALSLKWYSISPWISIVIGALISALVAVIIGGPLLRLRGHYFAIATMAIVEMTRIIFLNWNFIGGATGVSFQRLDLSPWYTLQFNLKHPFYYICLAFMVLFIAISKLFQGSKFGYYWRAINANQDSAACTGVNTTKYKIVAYAISAAIVSVGGSLYAQYLQYIDPMVLLPLANSMLIVLVCVMGGIGTVWGPVIGAFVMQFINEYSRSLFAHYGGLNLVIYGILVILIVLFLPKGIMSLFFGNKTKKLKKIKKEEAILDGKKDT